VQTERYRLRQEYEKAFEDYLAPPEKRIAQWIAEIEEQLWPASRNAGPVVLVQAASAYPKRR
jgi:hypothetical protein